MYLDWYLDFVVQIVVILTKGVNSVQAEVYENIYSVMSQFEAVWNCQ